MDIALGPSVRADTPQPVEAYAEIPVAQSVRLSPLGDKLALIAWANGQQILVVRDLAKGAKPLALGLGPYQTRWVAWKSDRRLIAGIFNATDHLFLFDPIGETMITRMVAIDSDGGHAVGMGEPLGGFDAGGTDWKHPLHPQIEDGVASLLRADPHHILQTVIDQVPYENTGVTPAVYRVDIDTGVHTRLLAAHPDIETYESDSLGVVRLGIGLRGADRVVYVRDDADSSWRLIHRSAANGSERFAPLAFVAGATNDALGHSDAALWSPRIVGLRHAIGDVRSFDRR